jgi:hypothetical protein
MKRILDYFVLCERHILSILNENRSSISKACIGSLLLLLLLLLRLLLLLLALQSFVGPSLLFLYLNLTYTVSRTPWMGISLLQSLYLHAGKHQQNKRTQTSMTPAGFNPTTLAFKCVKTVHALDHVQTEGK